MANMSNINKYFREALLETVPCAVFIVDTSEQIVFWNKSAVALTKFSSEEMVGENCLKLHLNICTTKDKSVLESFCPLRSGGEGGEIECNIRRKDGALVPVIRKSKAVYDDREQLIGAIEALVDVSLIKRARSEIRNLKREIAQSGKFGELVGSSREMRKLYDMIMMVAGTDANIVIEGKTGTGKELVAKTIHTESSRSDNIFLAINCGAVPESLLEAELFGHKKGAFTGAVTDRAGCFETASGGTLFLDEIAEMPLSSQVKLLRVLQESEITRLGDNLPRSVDVRVIAATNKNLSHQVKNGEFREDLYYRLNVVNLMVPPLRNRKEDIADLVAHFIKQFNRNYHKEIEGCSPQVLDLLVNYDWPGNIRQLEHAMEHAFVVTAGDKKAITIENLPLEIAEHKQTRLVYTSNEFDSIDEKTKISNALAQANGNKAETARILGITRAGLYKKIKRLGL